jgi:hypothetical protein
MVGRLQRYSPWRVARVLRDLLSKGRAAAAEADIPLGRILREQIALARAAGLGRSEYYLYALWRPHLPWREKLAFVGDGLRDELWQTLVPRTYRVLFQNKLISRRLLEAAGVPMPRLLGVYDPAWGATSGEAPLRTAGDLDRWLAHDAPDGFVVKPVEGERGRGLRAFTRSPDDPGLFISPEGTRMRTGEDFARVLTFRGELSGRRHADGTPFCRGFLIEERIGQHPCFDPFSPHACASMRAVAARGRDGRVQILSVVCHLQSAAQSHAQLGNTETDVIACVDPETGVLGEGVIKAHEQPPALRVQPATGREFTGLALPYWDAVRDVVVRAMNAIPMTWAVGWDVTIGESGPVLFEGNACFGFSTVQAPPLRVLLRGAILERCCDAPFPRLRKLARAVRDGRARGGPPEAAAG